jgi:hypothetical protein
MDKFVKFVIGFIVIGTILHFVINDDPLNFDWMFECKKTLATVGC